MPTEPNSFKRLLLGLPASAPDRPLRLAVEIADLLNLQLHGLFLDDPSLRDLARIPFARELRLLGGGWHPIDVDRLASDLDLAARKMERQFLEAAGKLATKPLFEVVRGPAASIGAVSRAGDIVMLAEPPSPTQRATPQFSQLVSSALQSDAAVMLVPPQVSRTKGPVVAVVSGPDDPALPAAAQIASAAKEGLIVVETDGSSERGRRTGEGDPSFEAAGLVTARVVIGKSPLSDPAARADAFRDFKERLVVITRGVLAHETTLSVAAAGRVPLLVVEPAR
jgi:hypothetical protein